MRISHHWLLVAALLVASAAPFAAPLLAAEPTPCSATQGNDGAACALAKMLQERFIYPEQGTRYASTLRDAVATGRYKALTPKEAAAAMTADLQRTAPEGHLHVRLSEPEIAQGVIAAPANRPPFPIIEQNGWIAPGIAYLRINEFPDDPAVTRRVAAFMTAHAGAKTLIFDLRTHHGGGLQQMDAILPWLFAKPTRLVTMETSWSTEREWGSPVAGLPSLRMLPDRDMARREHWVTPGTDPRLRDAKVYALTSPRTASAAEHFALAMKATGRGTLVGTATAGANHFGRGIDLPGGLSAFVPIGRTFDPATGKDWEGDGVAPDIAVPAEAALERALTDLGVTPAEALKLSAQYKPTLSMERRKRA